MILTIEELNRVSEECGASEYVINYYLFSPKELQAFAQHWIEVGRKEQREKDALICDEEADIANNQARNGGRALDDGRAIGAEACAEAIRNKTGE